MKKIVLCVTTICVALTAQAITIFDDFGAGNTYQQGIGYTLGANTTSASGAQFVAGGTGLLTTVDLGVTYVFQAPVFAYLYADAAGTPDNANQIFLGSGTPTAQFGSTNNTVLSLSVINVAPVTIGTTYWLVLKIADPVNDWDVWNFNTVGASGSIAQTFVDNNSTTFGGVLPTFRLLASELPSGNGVPDSGGTFVMLAGSVAVLFAVRRVKDCVSRGWVQSAVLARY